MPLNPIILVIDDDAKIRSVLERLLRTEGWDVVAVPDGDAGLASFAEIDPDVVLLDVMMPGRNGLDVCRSLKSDPDSRLTPVVLLTGLGATEDRVRGIEAGADDFLSKPFDSVELIARVRSLLRLKQYTDQLERAESVVYALARCIEGKDPHTEGHCERLSMYATELGARLSLPQDEIIALRRAGVVHDLGKVAIPDSVLLKPGLLDDDEMAIMRQHPIVGEKICEGLQSFKLVRPIIRHHHERFNGTGYPDGLVGQEIPITARVMQVVDIYDALTTPRPYRVPLAPQPAFEILHEEEEKGFIDPDILPEFERLMFDTKNVN